LTVLFFPATKLAIQKGAKFSAIKKAAQNMGETFCTA